MYASVVLVCGLCIEGSVTLRKFLSLVGFASILKINTNDTFSSIYFLATPPITSSPRRRRKKQRNLTTEFDDITVLAILMTHFFIILTS